MVLVRFSKRLRDQGLTLGYLRHIYGADQYRKPSHGFETITQDGAYNALHIDIVGALCETAVATTLPKFVSLISHTTANNFLWNAFSTTKNVPSIDFEGPTCYGIFGTHHNDGHLILQEDDPNDIEHVLVIISIDGWCVWISGSTFGVDLTDPHLLEQGKRFRRYKEHRPRALRQSELFPWCFQQKDSQSLEENMIAYLQPHLLPEDTERLDRAIKFSENSDALFTHDFIVGLQKPRIASINSKILQKMKSRVAQRKP